MREGPGYLDAILVYVETNNGMTTFNEISGHVGAHIAQADKTDPTECRGIVIRVRSRF